MNVLIAGATGLVGRKLLFKLLMDDHISRVIALVRNSTRQRHPKLQELVANFDELENYQHDLKVDTVYCCLGTTMKKAGSRDQFYQVDYKYPLHLAELTLQNGARQYNLVTAMGANKKSIFFYNRVKGEVEEAITKLNFKNINIYRPSILVGERKERRLGEKIGIGIAKLIDPIMIGPLKKYRAIRGEHVAEAMLKVSLMDQQGVQIYSSDQLQKIAKS